MKFPSTQDVHADHPLEEHAHDSNCRSSPKSPVDTFSWDTRSGVAPTPDIVISPEGVDIEAMNARRTSGNNIRGPTKKTQRIFTARVSQAGKQARSYSSDNDNIFSIVEDEKPRISKLERIPRRPNTEPQATSTTAKTSTMRRPRYSLPNQPTTKLLPQQEVGKSNFDNAEVSVLRSGRHSLSPTGREAPRSMLGVGARSGRQSLSPTKREANRSLLEATGAVLPRPNRQSLSPTKREARRSQLDSTTASAFPRSGQKSLSPQKREARRRQLDAILFPRSGQQSGQQQSLSPPSREAHFGRQRELPSPKKLFSSNQQPTVKPPKRLDSWLPPPPIEQKNLTGTPSTVCSVDEWSSASWAETPAVASKKTIYP